MKKVVLGALAMLAHLIGSAVSAAAPAVLTSQSPVKNTRSRTPGKPGKAGDKIARHAAENRLGIRR